MAGDWIKLEHATLDKPEVYRIAELLNVSRREAIGILLDFWVWLDRNSCNGCVTLMSRKSVEDVTHCPGFSACLIEVGWAKWDEKTGQLTVSNFDRHNGNTAKTRALGKDRAVTQRSRKSNAQCVTREEKRREEYLTTKTIMSSSQANADVIPLAKSTQRNQEATALLEFLNTKTGRHYRPTATTIKPILARLRDGFTVDECRAVIARKCRDWKGDDKMEPYLRPATLFGDQKFSQYVGEVPPETADAMP